MFLGTEVKVGVWASGHCQERGIVLIDLLDGEVELTGQWHSWQWLMDFVTSFHRVQPEVLKAKKSWLLEMKEKFKDDTL